MTKPNKSPEELLRVDNDRSLKTDGGAAAPFMTTAEVDETKWDRYRQTINAYILTPLTIIRRDPRALVAISIFAVYALMGAIAAFVLEPTYPYHGEQWLQPFQSMDHPLGTDNLGHDLMYQAFYSIIPLGQMMIAGMIFVIVMGTSIGVVAGYKGGTVDRILSTITDVFINLPGLPLVIVLVILFEPRNEFVIGILLSVAAWAGLARAIRSQVLTIREEAFVEAARSMDVLLHTILYKEILPHLMPYIAVNAANAARRVIFAAVGLYFLGILPYTGANWGDMLSSAYASDSFYVTSRVHYLLVPLIFIIVFSIALILFAQSLERVFNPRVRARHAERATFEDIDEEGGAEPGIMKV